MNLKLRTLTPLHVGDGSTLHPFDYTIIDNRFYRCSTQFFEQFLEELGNDAGQQFVDWSGEIMDKMVDLDEKRLQNPQQRKDFNQQLSELRRSHNLLGFAENKLQKKDFFLNYVKENAPSIPKQPVERGEKEKQEYRGFQRGSDGMPFLPGSSVKGCIRTALLYHFLEKHADHTKISDILKSNIEKVKKGKREADERKKRFNPKHYQKKFCEELEQLAFFAEMNDERGNRRQQEAQDDLLRCLLVADTPVSNDAMGMENIDLYVVKKQPKNVGSGFEGQRQTQAPAVEAILEGQILDVKIDFNFELLLYLHRNTGGEGLTVGREKHFIGWRERAESLFNLTKADFDAVPENSKSNSDAIAALQKKAFDHLVDCCRKFSEAQVIALKNWSQNFGKCARDKWMSRNLDAGMEAILNAAGARLHLGFGTGFEGMTVVLHLLAKHKEQFAEIMGLFGIGDSPSAGKKRRPEQVYLANPDRFPTSRRLATRAGVIYPLGWLEWVDDPNALRTQTIENQKVVSKSTAPAEPVFLRGSLKQGAELDAELLEGGNPGKFKLFVRKDYLPVVEVKYAAGFKPNDVGRLARIRVKSVNGKGEILAVEFVKFS